VADHINSDRNGDGWDSPEIWNALDPGHLLGVGFEVSGASSNITEVWSTNVNSAPDDSIIHGPEGTANGLEFHNGTTMTLYPAINPTVRGTVWQSGFPQGTSGAMAARSVYGNGRVFFVGDSSPIDDGSAQPGNSSIYDGWGEAAGNDSLLMLNATWWVTRRDAAVLAVEPRREATLAAFPNPFRGSVRMTLSLPAPGDWTVDVFDVHGRMVRRLGDGPFAAGRHEITWDGRRSNGRSAPAGLYFVSARSGTVSKRWSVVRVR
jgi:FlgD Ig-like domain